MTEKRNKRMCKTNKIKKEQPKDKWSTKQKLDSDWEDPGE